MLSSTATKNCDNCRVKEGQRHASWCTRDRPKKKNSRSITYEMEDALAEITGLFGTRGWAEIKLEFPDKTCKTLPVSEAAYEIVQRCRLLLQERGRTPIAP